MIETPLGWIHVEYDSNSIKSLYFTDKTLDNPTKIIDNQIFDKIKNGIKNYFNKQLTSFKFTLNPEGTPFQKRVWKELEKIPYGSTCSYQELAIRLGGKEKTRAVATAIAKNPILILIPCHRVIGSNGKLTGFSGGLNRKRVLLELEGNSVIE
ncbi:MAG: methylated-DNA--[protein]-cysteine S-methyltransferase [Chitinophagia bacterium]|nr:methylated-DNA--[protein]-cysteine S-methyltransferase [Chitinophagia bacterium]